MLAPPWDALLQHFMLMDLTFITSYGAFRSLDW